MIAIVQNLGILITLAVGLEPIPVIGEPQEDGVRLGAGLVQLQFFEVMRDALELALGGVAADRECAIHPLIVRVGLLDSLLRILMGLLVLVNLHGDRRYCRAMQLLAREFPLRTREPGTRPRDHIRRLL